MLREIGQPIDFRLVQSIEPTVEAAIACTSLMLSLSDRPTALFCTNDTIAIGAMKAVLRAGLRIPQDIAIVGFDDSENSRLVEPELTTVHVDKVAMGRIAAERLIAQIEQGPAEKQVIHLTAGRRRCDCKLRSSMWGMAMPS